jgi:ankyrin repeat protein
LTVDGHSGRKDRPEVVLQLQAAGEDIDQTDRYRETPLSIAGVFGDAASKLLAAGANVNQTNNQAVAGLLSGCEAIKAARFLSLS